MAQGIDIGQVRQKLNMPDLTDAAIRTVLASKGITTQDAADKWASSNAPAQPAGGVLGFLQQIPGGAERTLKDIASYPAQAYGAANQLANDVPGRQALANWLQQNVYNPVGSFEKGLFAAGGGQPGSSSSSKAKEGAKAPTTVQEPLNLGAEINAATAPYYAQMAQAAQQGVPGGLGQYLNSHVPALTDLAIGAGAQNLQHAEAAAPGAYQQAAAGASSAGQLSDLINAIRYIDIYKQGQFGAPNPQSNPLLAQLYGYVQQGQSGAFGTKFSTPTGTGGGSLPGGTQSPTNPTGANNPFNATPPKV